MKNKLIKMVVLESPVLNGALLGGPYAQGAPALKMMSKRYMGLHHWLGPLATTTTTAAAAAAASVTSAKEFKEQLVSF